MSPLVLFIKIGLLENHSVSKMVFSTIITGQTHQMYFPSQIKINIQMDIFHNSMFLVYSAFLRPFLIT